MLESRFLINSIENYKLSPYLYLTKQYFFKKKRIKYKKFKPVFAVNMYSELYKHKVYSMHYYISLLKRAKINKKLDKFYAYQFYFFNSSGLLKQGLIKDILIYTLQWRRSKSKTEHNSFILQGYSYNYLKYSVNMVSDFVLSNNSKYSIKLYKTNYSIRMNYFKNNLLKMEKIEYLKVLNYTNIVSSLAFSSWNTFKSVKILRAFAKKERINSFYWRWWKALWNGKNKKFDYHFNIEQLFFFRLNIALIQQILIKKLFDYYVLLYLSYTIFYVYSFKNESLELKRFSKKR